MPLEFIVQVSQLHLPEKIDVQSRVSMFFGKRDTDNEANEGLKF
jgi:hypothetical protein